MRIQGEEGYKKGRVMIRWVVWERVREVLRGGVRVG